MGVLIMTEEEPNFDLAAKKKKKKKKTRMRTTKMTKSKRTTTMMKFTAMWMSQWCLQTKTIFMIVVNTIAYNPSMISMTTLSTHAPSTLATAAQSGQSRTNLSVYLTTTATKHITG